MLKLYLARHAIHNFLEFSGMQLCSLIRYNFSVCNLFKKGERCKQTKKANFETLEGGF